MLLVLNDPDPQVTIKVFLSVLISLTHNIVAPMEPWFVPLVSLGDSFGICYYTAVP